MKNLILMVMIFSLSHVQAQLSTVEMKKVDDVIASTFEKLRERWEENQ